MLDMKRQGCLVLSGFTLVVLALSFFAVYQTLEPLPDRDEAEKLFLSEHANAQVVRTDLVEGDGHHIYWQIRFTRPPEAKVLSQEYGFRADGKGGYTTFYRSAETPDF
jgi:hypothetical protein